MGKKLINLAHNKCDYECMWNGIEDIYCDKTKEEIPEFFFFCLSGIGNFVYLKQPNGDAKRFAAWNDGRTKKMYQSVAATIGFSYKHIEGRTFAYAMKKSKEQIDQGKPVVLGCLDMYYLEYYPKFYFKEHIPIHYVLMVGYDDEKRCAYILDCGVKEVQEISYELLEQALNVEKTSLGDKNSICIIDFVEHQKSVIEIAKECFFSKANAMLEPKAGFVGIKGMHKLAKEFPCWKQELSTEDYEKALRNIVMFTGTVPVLPNKLRGMDAQNEILHMADREKLSGVLVHLGEKYQIPSWIKSAKLFQESGEFIQSMTNQITDYLVGEQNDLDRVPEIILQIAHLEEKAYQEMLIGAKEDID